MISSSARLQIDLHTQSSALDRLAAFAARLLEVPVAAVYLGEPALLHLKCGAGPVDRVEQDFRAAAWELRSEMNGAEPVIFNNLEEQPRLGRKMKLLRSLAAVSIPMWDGITTGILIGGHTQPQSDAKDRRRVLKDVAAMVANQLELEHRRGEQVEPGERRKTQEQLLEKTLELAKFSEDLRQLHRLSTTNYDALEDLFYDYLDTGRAILGLACGVVTQTRGRYAAIRSVRSDAVCLRAGMTFELAEVYCGVVCEERSTLACSWTSEDVRLAGRAHYGPSPQAAYIGAPILVEGEIYGVLSFSSPHARTRAFSSHETELIELMAKSIGRSILERRMQTARRRSEALERDRSQVLEMVAKDLPLEVVLEQIVRMVERQSASLTGAVHVVRNGSLYCLSAPGMPEHFRRRMQGVPVPRQEGCCLAAAHTRSTEVFDVLNPKCQNEEHSTVVQDHCWQACGASAILSGGGEVLGLLTVYWKGAVQPRPIDRDLLEMASSLAAIAMEHRRLADRLAHQAHHDTLTSLPNRMLLTKTLGEKILLSRHSGTPLGVVFIDLDRFKQINDHMGHAAGDMVLRETAARIESCLREGEIAARLGGDEFVAILEAPDEEAMRSRSRDILEAVRAPMAWNGQILHVTASIGISIYPQNGDSAEALLGGADLAMYRVKNNGKNDVQCFAPEFEGARLTRLELEHSLRHALERNEFQLYFQPILDIRGDAGVALEGFEVLLGWDHPTMGRIPPGQFIPIAEECGMIGAIGEWVLKQACLHNAEWRRRGMTPVRLSVNVSPLQFARPDFWDTVMAALEESGLSGASLELELTEGIILENLENALPTLERLRHAGVRLALDDFGTGYSSLGYLRLIPVDCLKIDQSFVAEIDSSASALTLVQTILALAHNMGIVVVAEGVERARQLELLRGFHCDRAQGHWFGGPMPVEEAERWLASRAAGP
ncbi:MAG TPA: EAL domain-containing protein [Bryobacteraceae bacterium]|nr:EAL domain-containing protein [Bryobacteraceae bacterium]